MTTSEPDPRVFFASERTLLAWVRTGLAIIGLGYVVARFGLFLRIMAREAGQTATISHNPVSRLIGVAFVVVGAVSMVMASFQHRAFIKGLAAKDLPTNYSLGFALWVSVAISLLGVALAAYLISVRP
jgi:putative membrane protein